MSEVVQPQMAGETALRGSVWIYLAWFAGLLCLNYGPVIANITHQWRVSQDMAHGALVPLIAGYIVWEKREEVLRLPSEPCGWGLGVMAVGMVLAVIGSVAAEIFTIRVAFVTSLLGTVLYVAGRRIFGVLLFPLMLLWFMLPLPGVLYKQITFPLQLLATRLAEGMLDVTGFMALREGNILELAGRQLSVVEACSGIKALLSLSFFSLCYAYFFSGRVWMRWVMLAATVPVAIFSNAFRVYTTAVLGEYDEALAEGFFHTLSGWSIFVVAIVVLMVIHGAINRIAKRVAR